MLLRSFTVRPLLVPAESELQLPGSKSHANRAIIVACLAPGTTIIEGATHCEDIDVMVKNLQQMGFHIDWVSSGGKEVLRIVGGIPSNPQKDVKELWCENAGTTLRFLVSLASIVPGNWVITGNDHMRRRPIRDLTTALVSLGVEISDTDGCPPLSIRGGTLSGKNVKLDAGKSSQFLTSLLLIAPLLPSGLTIEITGTLASGGYIELTKKVMEDFGVNVLQESNKFIVQHSQYRSPAQYSIEGDWSAAGPWIALNAVSGSRITFANLHNNSSQADSAFPGVIAKLCNAEGDITIDCREIPDQVMNLSIVTAHREGKTRVIGAKNLRLKECDRLRVLREELTKIGIEITEHEDGVEICGKKHPSYGPKPGVQRVTLNPHDDHRMAMCFGIFGLLHHGITVANPECTKKSYSQFFSDLTAVRTSSLPIVIVGMRGSGKSSLGRRLAKVLHLPHIDTDAVFEEKFGPVRAFVNMHGWAEFRVKEEDIVASSLGASRVISLGGGAVMSPLTRERIKKKAIVIWLDARDEELVARIERSKRPALTDLPLKEEVQKLRAERTPMYREIANIFIPATVPFSRQVSYTKGMLSTLVRTFDIPRKSLPSAVCHLS